MLRQAELDQIGGRLRAASRDGGAIEAAQVKVLGLDDIRAAAGPRWPRMRERVREGSLHILRQHLGADDVAISAGDGFLIILADGRSPRALEALCAGMREALVAFYLGEDALKSLRAEISGQSLSADSLNQLISASMKQEQAAAPPTTGEMVRAEIRTALNGGLAAWTMAPLIRGGGGRRIGYNPDYLAEGRHPAGADFLETDCALLNESVAGLEAALTAGKACAMGVYAHVTTLQRRKSREVYASSLSQVDAGLRRHLFVIVAEIDKGAPLISIAEWTGVLRTHVGRIWLTFHHTDQALAGMGNAGAWAAGFDLPHLGAPDSPRAQNKLQQLGVWARAIHAQKMRCFIGGLLEPASRAEAARAGADFIVGEAQAPAPSAL